LVRILVVEDNPADADLLAEHLLGLGQPVELTAVDDGAAALARLRSPEYPLPDLVILDLNLPGLSGTDVLGDIKRDPSLRRLPVVVFTHSDAESDVATTYDLGANCFITKPKTLAEFRITVDRLQEFWFRVATLPPLPPKA
jgi:two-component system, chemotaxis family, response regulator Rcp1